MKIGALRPTFVEYIPADLAPGVLYVSMPYATALHLCACGCGSKTVTPLSATGWIMTFDGTVTLRPSIGNGQFPCRSHYLIDHDDITWLPPIGKTATRAAAASDRRALVDLHPPRPSFWRRMWRRVRRAARAGAGSR